MKGMNFAGLLVVCIIVFCIGYGVGRHHESNADRVVAVDVKTVTGGDENFMSKEIELDQHWFKDTQGYGGEKLLMLHRVVYAGENTGDLIRIMVPVEKTEVRMVEGGGEKPVVSISAHLSHTLQSRGGPEQFWLGRSATITVSNKKQQENWTDFLKSFTVEGAVYKENAKWMFVDDARGHHPLVISNPEKIEKMSASFHPAGEPADWIYRANLRVCSVASGGNADPSLRIIEMRLFGQFHPHIECVKKYAENPEKYKVWLEPEKK